MDCGLNTTHYNIKHMKDTCTTCIFDKSLLKTQEYLLHKKIGIRIIGEKSQAKKWVITK